MPEPWFLISAEWAPYAAMMAMASGTAYLLFMGWRAGRRIAQDRPARPPKANVDRVTTETEAVRHVITPGRERATSYQSTYAVDSDTYLPSCEVFGRSAKLSLLKLDASSYVFLGWGVRCAVQDPSGLTVVKDVPASSVNPVSFIYPGDFSGASSDPRAGEYTVRWLVQESPIAALFGSGLKQLAVTKFAMY